MQDQSRQSLSVPVAIIVAGALIAGGIYFSGRTSAPGQAAAVAKPPQAEAVAIKAPGPNDHVLGSRNAPIMIVEYSDIECPFCKQFHGTLHKLMDEYGTKGQLAWTFRHFPVHKNSVKEGEATECAAELGGNDAFWKYTDRIFELTPSNDGLDLAQLPVIAKSIGLDEAAFKACLDSGKHAARINQDRADVIGAGAQGTPYSVIFANGEQIPITQGALPYAEMKAIIDALIKNS